LLFTRLPLNIPTPLIDSTTDEGTVDVQRAEALVHH